MRLIVLLAFGSILLSEAQPVASKRKLKVRVGNTVGSASAIELVPGPNVILGMNCSAGICTVVVHGTPGAVPNTVDYSGASKTILARAGSSLPGTCQTGEWFFLSSAAPGRNLHLCVPANHWRPIGAEAAEVAWEDLTGDPTDNPALAALLESKAGVNHQHSASDIASGRIDAARLGSGPATAGRFLRGDQSWSEVGWSDLAGKPSQFPPELHSHSMEEITGLEAALAARAPLVHSHSADDVISGRLTPERLGSGTAEASAVLHGDGVWRRPAWSSLSGVPEAFPPAGHSHGLADLQSGGAQPGQVLKWNGSSWAPADESGSAGNFIPSPASPQAGQFLRYSGSEWTAAAVGWADIENLPAQFPPSAHGHSMADIAGLQAALDGKAPLEHAHAAGDIVSGRIAPQRLGDDWPGADSSFFLAADGFWRKPSYAQLSGVPETFPPTPHVHSLADLQPQGAQPGQVIQWTGLAWQPGWIQWGEIASRPAQFPPSAHEHSISDVAGLADALSGKAPLAHSHPASDIVSGIINPNRLGVGWSMDSSLFLSADSTWRRVSFIDLDDVPAAFPPSSHTHPISEIDGLQAALNSKASLAHTHAPSEIQSG